MTKENEQWVNSFNPLNQVYVFNNDEVKYIRTIK